MNAYITAAPAAPGPAANGCSSRLSTLCRLSTPGRSLGALALILGLCAAAPASAAQGFLQSDLPVGQDPRDVAIADFNWDGRDDLAIANQASNNVSVLWGYPGAVFAPAFSVPVGPGPAAIVAADFSGDGIVDLATANSGNGTVSLARGKGDGTFYPAPSYPSGSLPRDLDAADIDGDGLLDIVVAHDDASASVVWLRSLGNGALAPAQVVASGFKASSVCVGDLDGVGGLDIAVGNLSDDTVTILLDAGAGSFVVAQNLSAQAAPDSVRLVDLDGDGSLDVLAANTGGDAISVYFGNGSALDEGLQVPCGATPSALAVGDVTGDEIVDLIVVSLAGNVVTTVAGTAGGGFAAPSSLASGMAPVGLGLADLDGDFLLDVITANGPANGISILTNGAGPWIDLGGAAVGSAGSFELLASGVPVAGAMVTLTPRNDAAGAASGWLAAGVSKLSASFQGGVMVPDPLWVLPATANVPLGLHWPSGMPAGSSLYLQAWFGVGAGDASSTNALRAIVQAP